MSDEPRPGEVFEIEPTHREGLLTRLPWWLIAMVAVLVTELTTHPSVGVVVFCFKFGWNDFVTAIWLRRNDPYAVRGRICSWFYGASGLWRVCISGFALMFALVPFVAMVEARPAAGGVRQNAGEQPPTELIACMIVWLVSSIAATFATFLAVWMARRSPTKVWISSVLPESRRQNEWPPRIRIGSRPPSNLLKWWMILASIVVSIPLSIAGIVLLVSVLGGPVAAGPRLGGKAVLGPLLLTTIVFILPIIIILLSERTYRRLGASSPWNCWLEPEVRTDSDSYD